MVSCPVAESNGSNSAKVKITSDFVYKNLILTLLTKAIRQFKFSLDRYIKDRKEFQGISVSYLHLSVDKEDWEFKATSTGIYDPTDPTKSFKFIFGEFKAKLRVNVEYDGKKHEFWIEGLQGNINNTHSVSWKGPNRIWPIKVAEEVKKHVDSLRKSTVN